jgi:hypothetical protein
MTSESDDKSPRSSPSPENAEPRFEELGRKVDQEIEELIRWFNDDVVVSARGHSSRALRAAAERLARFADHLDDIKRGQ